mgnify:CR=1 FL=1
MATGVSINMKKIALTQGKFTLVSDRDYKWLSQMKWHINKARNKCYAYHTFKRICGKSKFLSMHRLIKGEPQALFVDHKNGDSLDNRRSNLRVCTNQENLRTSVKGKMFYIGIYKNKMEATLAYDHFIKKLHGKFARLNFPS